MNDLHPIDTEELAAWLAKRPKALVSIQSLPTADGANLETRMIFYDASKYPQLGDDDVIYFLFIKEQE